MNSREFHHERQLRWIGEHDSHVTRRIQGQKVLLEIERCERSRSFQVLLVLHLFRVLTNLLVVLPEKCLERVRAQRVEIGILQLDLLVVRLQKVGFSQCLFQLNEFVGTRRRSLPNERRCARGTLRTHTDGCRCIDRFHRRLLLVGVDIRFPFLIVRRIEMGVRQVRLVDVKLETEVPFSRLLFASSMMAAYVIVAI